VVWRARRRAGAVASGGVTDDATAFSHHGAAPGDPVREPVAVNDAPAPDTAGVGVEPVEVQTVPIDPAGSAADDADEPVTAARVFLAADAPPVEDDTDDIEPVDAEPVDAEPVDTGPAEPAEPELAVAEPDAGAEPEPLLDLERIERDLAGVEAALRRLDDGTYWTDEITGEPIDELVLAADPVARRNR
jgi:hypothetical protein